VTITEDSTTLHYVFLHDWDHSLDAFVFDAVDYVDLCATTEHSEHPTNYNVVP
jgi:hypothetical protein